MHNLKFDPSTPEGAEIVDLFNGIKEHIEDDSGGWNGGDVVDALTQWFADLGIDVDADTITTDVAPAVTD
ncbi:hypothetical protein [Kitasatospora sp. NPDC093679]|uniref:hypothetical protein n=1 Tax=Kitasatospora sp. NPDC093679 TaxID=3154983 RepID=UPI0034308EEB